MSDERPAVWESHAEWWQREFTDGVDPEYVEQIIPLVLERIGNPRRVLDVGTGEGQVARAVAAASDATVVGVDPTRSLITSAAQRDGGVRYVLARADLLPMASASIDLVVVCLVFEHVDAFEESIIEVARVLRPGGRFVFLLNHPLLQTPGSGMIVDHVLDPPETYWRIGPYLPEAETVEEVQRGVRVRFLHRPLSRYVNALISSGLSIVEMVEPAPPEGFAAKAPEYEHEVVRTTPRLLALIADKAADTLRRP